jgi:hypothetical protein
MKKQISNWIKMIKARISKAINYSFLPWIMNTKTKSKAAEQVQFMLVKLAVFLIAGFLLSIFLWAHTNATVVEYSLYVLTFSGLILDIAYFAISKKGIPVASVISLLATMWFCTLLTHTPTWNVPFTLYLFLSPLVTAMFFSLISFFQSVKINKEVTSS